jgi:spore germination cell wall hydrolase CwlJ-like protein
MKILLLTIYFLGVAGIAKADEIQVIAEVIAAEAGGEGYQGMYAVACTIANRSRLWRKTPYEIVTQKNQYYGYTAKNRHKLYLQVKPIVDKLAREIMRLKDITKGALYFRRQDERLFPWCKIETFRYKNHIFYK